MYGTVQTRYPVYCAPRTTCLAANRVGPMEPQLGAGRGPVTGLYSYQPREAWLAS